MDTEESLPSPASDSRPIRFEALLDHEKELISRANGLLRGLYEEVKKDVKRRQNPSDPWATVDHSRRHQVLMLSGPRGSGKTSLMLTLLAGWRAAWTEDWEAVTDSAHRKGAEDLFRAMAPVVRSLQPLDFDPLPPDLPLYGWIVQAFRPLVTWLMGNGQSQQERASLPWSDTPPRKTLREQLQDLYQTAIVGWGSGKLRDAFQKDLYDLVLDQENQHLNWQQLQESWKRFLDDLFKELDRRSDVFPKNGLLVLPIDDADMQIERDRELIMAVRLLCHPRLVYLLTGDVKNLRENLTLEGLSRMMRTLAPFRHSTLADESRERARGLAHALTQKVLPSFHLLKMEKLTLREFLEWNEKTSDNLFGKIPIKQNVSLRDFLQKRPQSLDFDCLPLRQLQQLADRHTPTQRLSEEALADFLEILMHDEDEDEFTVGDRENPIVLHTYPGLIVPVARVYHAARLSLHVEVRVGVKLEFNQERITEELSGDKRLVLTSPFTLLALDLAAEAEAPRRIYVAQHSPTFRPPQCLAWSIWHGTSYETWLPWPSIGTRSPTELVQRAEAWAEEVGKLSRDENPEWIDCMAFIWIRLHLLWLKVNENELPAALESNQGMEEAWVLLSDFLRSPNSEARSLRWFQMELPLLTAPEYGLSKKRQEQLFMALQDPNSPPQPNQEWHNFRLKAVRDAKRFRPGQAPADLFKVYADSQDLDIDREDVARTTLQEIATAFPDSPWSH